MQALRLRRRLAVVSLLAAAGLPPASPCAAQTGLAEASVITQGNYDELVPSGKEVDAIVGDYVLRNDRIVAVIGRPVEGRHANHRARDVGGCVIDLALRDRPNDLLTAFAPGPDGAIWRNPRLDATGGAQSGRGAGESVSGKRVTLTLVSEARRARPATHLTYALEAGAEWIEVTTESGGGAVAISDEISADGPSFEWIPAGSTELVWAHDPWFGQAYGVSAPGRSGSASTRDDRTTIAWGKAGGALTRRLYPGADLFAVMSISHRMAGRSLHPVRVSVTDSEGQPVSGADVVALRGGALSGQARTGNDGTLDVALPRGAYALRVSSPGRGERQLDVSVAAPPAASSDAPRAPLELKATLDAAAAVTGAVTGEAGGPIPAKVMFVGVKKTPTPDFGPIVNDEHVKNLVYTPDGRFARILPPGDYRVTASHGPEHDVVTKEVHVPRGPAQVPFRASLRRSVATPGWISADFHGHSTTSCDTAAGRRGRVLNYAAEGVEFAPCTEHNRIDTYVPLIEEMRLTEHLATSDGIELTGRGFALNHQNAFPLVMRPRTQGNGAPRPDGDVMVQIRRLASWDHHSEKLVQQNHPDIGWIFFDRDGDHHHDGGHEGIVKHQDVMEVWAEPIALTAPTISVEYDGRKFQANNRLFNWFQLLNQGMRLPGVANTDAHNNFHGSGGVRNYVRSSTDAPARIDPIEIVRQAESGHIVMTNGPYLEVSIEPAAGSDGGQPAIPGDEVFISGGHIALRVRVQCPNWFDVDRVQILVNGRPSDHLTFTRQSHPERFGGDTIKFDQRVEIALQGDAHVIVVASHSETLLLPIMGPRWGKQPPVAFSNPIYVDADGGGFSPSGDTLGHPLPVKGE